LKISLLAMRIISARVCLLPDFPVVIINFISKYFNSFVFSRLIIQLHNHISKNSIYNSHSVQTIRNHFCLCQFWRNLWVRWIKCFGD
jgi:hypothetical protein